MGNKVNNCCGDRNQNRTQDQQINYQDLFTQIDKKKNGKSSTNNQPTIDQNYFTFNQNEVNPEVLKQQNEINIAKDQDNVEKLIDELCNNNRIIIEVVGLSHPWASSPETLGSLATIYLGLHYNKEIMKLHQQVLLDDKEHDKQHEQLQNKVEDKRKELTAQFIKNGIIQKIKDNLNSEMQDRKELTVLLIYFLIKKNNEFQQELLINDVLGVLVDLIDNGIEKIQSGLVIKILQKLYKNRKGQIDHFIKQNGVEKYCQFLMNCQIDQCNSILNGINDLLISGEEQKVDQEIVAIMKSKQVDVYLAEFIDKLQMINANKNIANEKSFIKEKESMSEKAQELKKLIE